MFPDSARRKTFRRLHRLPAFASESQKRGKLMTPWASPHPRTQSTLTRVPQNGEPSLEGYVVPRAALAEPAGAY